MKPPAFFLSSTIYDFKDLRSAIKYHLEQSGCRVLASEFNDFPKPPDVHSYDACLRSIAESDWFILLIGGRVGGWYDETNRVSITQAEYREAYKLHQQGRLNILAFVRSEVWQAREDRRQLTRCLDQFELDPSIKTAIVNHPTKSLTDAEFIGKFITEVGRNQETKAARATGAPLPTGNWIHVFHSFADIADVLQLLPFANRPVEASAMRRLLRRELREVARQSLVKPTNDPAFSPRWAIDKFSRRNPISTADSNRDLITVYTDDFDNISSHSYTMLSVSYHTTVLDRALESPAFLRFDGARGHFTEEPVYDTLHQLSAEIRAFKRSRESTDSYAFITSHSPKRRGGKSEKITLEAFKLIMLLHLFDRWCNIGELCRVILRHLEGHPLDEPSLRPRSPLYDQNHKLEVEIVSDEEIDGFLGIVR